MSWIINNHHKHSKLGHNFVKKTTTNKQTKTKTKIKTQVSKNTSRVIKTLKANYNPGEKTK